MFNRNTQKYIKQFWIIHCIKGQILKLLIEQLLFPCQSQALKFIYSEKATKLCKIFTLLLSYGVPVKIKVNISQNFVAFSEYMNFTYKNSRKCLPYPFIRHISTLPVYLIFKNIPLYPLIRAYPFIRHLRVLIQGKGTKSKKMMILFFQI